MSHFVIEILTDASDLPDYRDDYERFALAANLSLENKLRLNLILDEVISNIAHHGLCNAPGHLIHLTFRIAAESVDIVVTDDAPPFDPFAPRPERPDLPIEDIAIGGLGLRLIETFTTGKDYHRAGNRNVVGLTFPLVAQPNL